MPDKSNLTEPRTLPGFMELAPDMQARFNYMQDTVRGVYELFGFSALDTPVLEYANVLLAKAGGETEKQIYRFIKGDTDMAMRFDLTVPLAKYVSRNYHTLSFPFRRYQIGKVFRGERPQKGRFREFYQCDIDIVGDGALNIAADAELPAVIYTVFKRLGFGAFKIYLNNRKILSGFLSGFSLEEKSAAIMGAVDKLKKIGAEKVRESLAALEISENAVGEIMRFISLGGSTDEQLSALKGYKGNALFLEGVRELAAVIQAVRESGVPDDNFAVDLKIVRGLDYYTGTVYETFLDGFEEIGSVCSGGRYDDLAGFYTDKKLPGVGISIGLTRLFDKLSEAAALRNQPPAEALVVSADGVNEGCAAVAAALRAQGIKTFAYSEDAKLKNKFKYAERLAIPFMAIIGETERANRTVTLKNIITGEQKENITVSEAAIRIKEYRT